MAVRGTQGKVDDLERLFHELVHILKQDDTERIRTSFQVSELYQSILPYRTHKQRLGFDTNQDYEMAVLRLLAGERGYVTVEPDEVRKQLAEEAQAINPDTGIFREYAAARVILNPGAVRSLDSTQDAYAPPTQKSHNTPTAAPPRPPVFEPVGDPTPTTRDKPDPGQEPAASGEVPSKADPESPLAAEAAAAVPSCPQCGEGLPSHRRVVFCPFCGARVSTIECTTCGETIEAGWRFCAKCGTPDRSA